MSGNYAYLAGWKYGGGLEQAGLEVIDVSNPANPQRVGNWMYDFGFGGSDSRVQAVAVRGNYAYVVDAVWGLQVINVSNPANPQWVGGDFASGANLDVAVSGNYAYVADGTLGLRIVNVSNPANPQQVGSYNTSGEAYGVALSGNYAYVADWGAGLQVINVSNPANPVRVGGYDTSGYGQGVAVSGNYAYVADGNWGLLIFGLARPESPPSPTPPAQLLFSIPTRFREQPTRWSTEQTSPRGTGNQSGHSRPPVSVLPRRTVPPSATSATIASSICPDESIRPFRVEAGVAAF